MNEPLQLKPRDYKSAVKPIWCPGCGHFSVLNALTKAFAALGIDKDDTVLVSGIGCSSRLPAYVDSYGFHSVHGRGLAIAQGLKVARPDLTVIALGGDGDGFSIGGNHFIHACRRNVNMTYIAMDNEVYGMTKGQASPTTASDWDHSKLTPHGPGVRPFKPAALALASGAPWIARGYSGNPNQTARLIAEAVEHPGFSFVHVLSQCITFCPEQTDWKSIVHEREEAPVADADEAARLFLHEDGFQTGVLYNAQRETWPPAAPDVKSNDLTLGFKI
ncbi:2-oxoacid:ferredoxin oxidoreductase subunit beta [Pseudohalioglobus sediminis]|uniref:2-oxoacid:ferredoxin oxidoreductase subunit beta n=1 Tax=Pseudohalioglobus sediminis TaxID=2606449 RepID=A0A5B0WUE7_9GAMM|nr:2-oxoacid:ferredoxin oxidoreductase subunit beta [Pseudohalioglobus sediminis]KAA1189489.1 2-oxoacid:ferredoxin oxidoreductase subunit beta [Pseudohalioglobus sediminis]